MSRAGIPQVRNSMLLIFIFMCTASSYQLAGLVKTATWRISRIGICARLKIEIFTVQIRDPLLCPHSPIGRGM